MPSGSPAAPHPLSPLSANTASIAWDAHPDAAELARLDAEGFAPAWTPAAYTGWLEHPQVTCWIVRARTNRLTDSASVGWAVSQRVEDEAEILRLGVRPSWRQLGWGRMLLDGVQERLKDAGAKRLFLEVRAGNSAARALYRAAGFRETGRRRGYYPGLPKTGPREDAVVMAWEVGEAPPSRG